MWKLFQLLKDFLSPRIGEDDELVVVDESELESEEVEETELEEEEEETSEFLEDDEPAPKAIGRREKEIISLRKSKQEAEDRYRKAQEELEAARRQPTQQINPTQDQQLWQQEEAYLKDPNGKEEVKYAIRASRDAREAKQESLNARAEAKDLHDKSVFERIAYDKPKTFEKYKDRVEEKLREIRKNGGNVERKIILQLLIGQDHLDGKLKATETKTKPKNGGASRGTTPGARSNVSSTGKGGLSPYEKAMKRLEGKKI